MTMKDSGVQVLIDSLQRLRDDLRDHPEEWENRSLEDYLESVQAWLQATTGRAPGEPSWKFVAGVFGVGKIYE